MSATEHPLKRTRGRPAGKKAVIAVAQLRHHHFSFVRAVVQGVGLRKAWERYLSFEDGPDDERHFATRLRDLVIQIRAASTERGLHAVARVALAAGLDSAALSKSSPPAPALPAPSTPPSAVSSLAAIPTLDAWIDERCQEQGIDVDFYTQGEWLADYQAEFGLDQPTQMLPATALPKSAPSPTSSLIPPLKDRLIALNELAAALAKPPTLSDTLGTWLSADLATRLAATAVDGKRLPLLTLGNLIAFVELYDHRWWTHVPRLGAGRADRLVAWLAPLAEHLGHPLRRTATHSYTELALERERAIKHVDDRRFGLAPLDRLVVPPEINGRHGAFRTNTINVFDVDTDLEAIFAWLRRFDGSPQTHAAYSRIIERLYNWSLWVKHKPLSSLNERDYHDYRDFLAKPPADWVQPRRANRDSAEWRPFRGALSPASRQLNFSVIAAMLNAFSKAGYISANAADGVLPSMKLQHLKINIDRSFNEAQWSWIMKCLNELEERQRRRLEQLQSTDVLRGDLDVTRRRQLRHAEYQAAGLRRTRLILELGTTTGLRLLEFVTTRRGALNRQVVEGESVWLLKVYGKGAKHREVWVADYIKSLLDQHHQDMADAGTNFDQANDHVRTLRGQKHEVEGDTEPADQDLAPEYGLPALPCPSLPGVDPAEAEAFDPMNLPLIGALRRAPPRWKNDALGVATLDRSGPRNADRYGSLDPTALYQVLKRFLGKCALMARSAGVDLDPVVLEQASTHWLRHFFANSSIADGVDVTAVRESMGHANLATTSIYLRTERKRMVSEMSKRRRRS